MFLYISYLNVQNWRWCMSCLFVAISSEKDVHETGKKHARLRSLLPEVIEGKQWWGGASPGGLAVANCTGIQWTGFSGSITHAEVGYTRMHILTSPSQSTHWIINTDRHGIVAIACPCWHIWEKENPSIHKRQCHTCHPKYRMFLGVELIPGHCISYYHSLYAIISF